MIKIKCKNCNKIFLSWKSKKRKYCSIKCMSKFFHSNPRVDFNGKNNPFYGKHHSIKTRKVMSQKGSDRVKKYGLPWTGKERTPEHRKNHSIALTGKYTRENSYAWKGGITKSHGYIFVYQPNHPNKNARGYIRRHRLIMETNIGRYLTRKEVVHHINGIKDDDRPENLILFPSKSTHIYHHWKLKKLNKIVPKKPLQNSSIGLRIIPFSSR